MCYLNRTLLQQSLDLSFFLSLLYPKKLSAKNIRIVRKKSTKGKIKNFGTIWSFIAKNIFL